MKKINILGLGLVAALTFCSCEDFLDSENYTGKDTSNFPMTEEDVDQMVSSVYKACFYEPWQDTGNNAEKYYSFSNLASDDMYGGGGQNDLSSQAMDHLLYQTDNQMDQYWTACYSTISRANSALAAVDNIADENKRNQTKGELLFLRALTYFDLAKCFGNVPLMEHAPEGIEEAQQSPEQKSPEEVFKKVASDLYVATQIMPSYKYDGWSGSTLKFGQASRWAAEALLARAYLYYTGFFNASSMPMLETEEYPGVTEVTKDYVVKCLNDVIQNSGHHLLADFRSLWAYANEETMKDYLFVSDLADHWKEGDAEALFSVNFAYRGEWDSQLHMTNQYALFFGIRFNDIDDSKFNIDGGGSVYPFGGGWGCGPVTPNFVSDWKTAEPNDPRFEASILTFPSDYNYAGDHNDNWMENTGYFQKKLSPVRSNGGNAGTGEGFYSFCSQISWGGAGATKGHYQASHCQALVLLRYADVLLMHSELTETPDGMNQVRARVGLPAVGYSLKALQNERRWELAFEGIRWDDIRRWHMAPEALAKQLGGKINNVGTWTEMRDQGEGYVARYNATNGYCKIPANQVTLSNGMLKQNPGWEGTSGYYGSWK